jgi:heavy metal sensor kinase
VRPLALTWRMSLVMAGTLSVVIAIVFAAAYTEAKEVVDRQVNLALSLSAQAAGAILESDEAPQEQSAELRAVVGAALLKRPAFCRVWVPGAQGSLHEEGLADKGSSLRDELARLAPPAPGRSVYFDLAWPDDPYRAVWTQAQTRAGVAYIVVGHSTRHMQTELREVRRAFLAVGGGVVLASVLLVILVVRWGLRPVGTTAAQLLQVTARNIGSVTLDGAKAPAELLPFVESVRGMLGRLNEALEQQKAFVADASHELRTPVALAKSTVQLALHKERTPEEYRKALVGAEEDLRRMEHLTEELLVLARMDETAGGGDEAEVDLAALLQELAETYSPVAARDGGQLACDLQPALVRGNEGQLGRLFGNLIDNAIKHGPKGGRVGISLRPGTAGWVIVTVSDEGGGIAPEALPRLFDRFFRADRSRSHATGGAGLGLAIARQIVLHHGGQIAITSEAQAGTRATVRLPVVARQA